MAVADTAAATERVAAVPDRPSARAIPLPFAFLQCLASVAAPSITQRLLDHGRTCVTLLPYSRSLEPLAFPN